LLRNWITCGVLAAVGAGYTREIEPFWLEEPELPMPLHGLPASFENFRLIQLTDLHASNNVPLDYLQSVVQRVNRRKPDLVVVTGDLVTHAIEWVAPICAVLAGLKAQVIVTLGNHDYDVNSMPAGLPTRVADAIEERCAAHGMTVLRNQAMAVSRAGRRLWIVGLEDLWSGRFNPEFAFAKVDPSDPVICLSHNPDTAMALDAYGPQWILSGHTHGGQVRLPFLPLFHLPEYGRKYIEGLFRLGPTQLYVNRGIGAVGVPFRFRCPPEITVLTLA
jgi:predicted MPP superfamily phosphohydrolase